MNYIEHVEINGFWGNKKVVLGFNNSENFLIGVNGSGKTTIINLIAATLSADFITLDRIQFQKIIIKLKSKADQRKKPKIEVIKSEDESTPYRRILFRIQHSIKEKPFEIYLDDLEEERLYRHPSDELRYRYHLGYSASDIKDLQVQLNKIVNLTWLSIHRYKTNYIRREERNRGSLIDQKINEFSTDLLKYLSLLNRRASEETDKFQEFIFLSLIASGSQRQLFKVISTIDLDKENEALAQVYSLFGLKEIDYRSKMEKYFKSFVKAKKNSEKGSISIDDVEYIIGLRRIHSVVQEWNKLVEKQNSIFKYRDTFLKIINSLLQKKSLIIDEKNELKVKTEEGKMLPLTNLSSGEKQLLIIMGETLLQQSSPHIFIADEPELSLHIQWQEKLVDSLKSINPNCQIIFATHSPDIVSHYSNSVLYVEKSIK